jgi:hypothetical protein
LVWALAPACSPAHESADDQEGADTAAALRVVDVIVSAKRTGEFYEARSYPSDDFNGNGLTELYKAPLFFVHVDGVDGKGAHVRREWKAPRFMPYYNDPKDPDTDYKTRGFVTAGLSSFPRQAIGRYNPDYEVHNRFSPFGGAIVVKGSFYIHAGPPDLEDTGWGSAGCVEIIGNFDAFKKDILELAGSTATDLNKGMSQLVAARKLFVTYEFADRPNLKAAFSREDQDEADDHDSDSNTDHTDPEE